MLSCFELGGMLGRSAGAAREFSAGTLLAGPRHRRNQTLEAKMTCLRFCTHQHSRATLATFQGRSCLQFRAITFDVMHHLGRVESPFGLTVSKSIPSEQAGAQQNESSRAVICNFEGLSNCTADGLNQAIPPVLMPSLYSHGFATTLE
jgi:hypothetical protein